jgi:hypothetical protein
MLRALIIEPRGNLWGSERALLDLVADLPDVEVAVCRPPQRPLLAELELRTIRLFPYFVHAMPENGCLERLRSAVGVLRAALEFRPDVLYLNQAACYRIVLPAAVLLGLPIVLMRVFSMTPPYLACQRPSPRRLRVVVAISEAIIEELRSFPELKVIRIERHYDAYVPGPVPLPTHEPRGQDALVEAMGLLKGDGANVECWMLGDASALSWNSCAGAPPMWAAAPHASPGLARATTLSRASAPARRYREGLGRVIFEAWDAGAVPIVCSNSGGPAEIVTAADAGVVYEEQSPQALAAGITRALALPRDEMARMVANGRAWLAANCEAKSYGVTIAGILRESCKAQSGKPEHG